MKPKGIVYAHREIVERKGDDAESEMEEPNKKKKKAAASC